MLHDKMWKEIEHLGGYGFGLGKDDYGLNKYSSGGTTQNSRNINTFWMVI